jgi:hypothetical protein
MIRECGVDWFRHLIFLDERLLVLWNGLLLLSMAVLVLVSRWQGWVRGLSTRVDLILDTDQITKVCCLGIQINGDT